MNKGGETMMDRVNLRANKWINSIENTGKIVWIIVSSKLLYIPVIIVAMCIGLKMFFDIYTLRSPIIVILQSPLYKREVKVYEKKVPFAVEITDTEERVIMTSKRPGLVRNVYLLESSLGVNDGCRDKGKYNGFGYGQNSDGWACFDSFEQVVRKVDAWFDQRLGSNGNNLPEAVCLYNQGISGQETCSYYESFMSIN
jgi:hypothetical protein